MQVEGYNIMTTSKTTHLEGTMIEINEKLPITAEPAVNVIVKHDRPDDAAVEIDLLHIFVNMWQKKRIYAWVIILCLLVGLATPLLMAELAEKSESVSAVLTLNYAGANRQLAPDKTPLNLSYITSSYVLQQALAQTKLTTPISLSSLAGNINVEMLLSEDTRQQLEVMSQVQSVSSKSADVIESVQDVEYIYENQVIVTLDNGFGDGSEREKKVYLEGSELAALLNNIVTAYSEYFYTTYNAWTLPEQNIANIDRENLDYVEQLDKINTVMRTLSRYCTDEEKADYLNYRSKIDGMSFADINKTINLISKVNINYLYSYVYYNWASKNKSEMLTKLNYSARSLQRDYDTLMENIATNSEVIANYKNENIVVAMQDGSTTQLSSAVTDYYNEQVLLQADYYAQKAELAESIADVNDKIEGFTNSGSSAARTSQIETEMDRTYALCAAIYDQVYQHAKEILDSDAYRSSFMTIMDATYYGEGFLSAGTIKKTLIGGAVGVVAALVLWCCDGFVVELKLSEQKRRKGETA